MSSELETQALKNNESFRFCEDAVVMEEQPQQQAGLLGQAV